MKRVVSRRKVILIILSDIKKAKEHEWFCDRADRSKFEYIFIQINAKGSEMDSFIQKHGYTNYNFLVAGKLTLIPLIYKIISIIKKHRVDVIHSHLFTASFAGMIAGKLAGVNKRIHTRHHSNFHHTYHPSTVKYDRLINRLSTDIIAISKNVYDILVDLEGVSPDKIRLIYHGFDTEQFDRKSVTDDRVNKIYHNYQYNSDQFNVGVISRYTHWKGVQYIIPAFKKFQEKYKDTRLVLANAKGDYKLKIQELLKELDSRSYVEIPFENDSAALYSTFDVFVHVPIDKMSEAFGQIYIEALAAEIPSIFSLSGIAPEFIEDHKNAFVVPFQDSDAIFAALEEVYLNRDKLKSLTEQGKLAVETLFSIDKKITTLQKLYKN